MLSANHFLRAQIKGSRLEAVLSSAPLRLLSIAFTFLCINFCWVVFRALSLDGALRVYTAMLTGPFSLQPGPTGGLLPNHYFQGWQPFALLILCAVLVWAFPNSRGKFSRAAATAPGPGWPGGLPGSGPRVWPCWLLRR